MLDFCFLLDSLYDGIAVISIFKIKSGSACLGQSKYMILIYFIMKGTWCIPHFHLLYRITSFYYSSSRSALHRVPSPHNNTVDSVTLNQVQHCCASRTLPINIKQKDLKIKQDNLHYYYYWQERIAITSTSNLSLYLDPINLLDKHIMNYISGSRFMKSYKKAMLLHLNKGHLDFVYNSEKLILYCFLFICIILVIQHLLNAS